MQLLIVWFIEMVVRRPEKVAAYSGQEVLID